MIIGIIGALKEEVDSFLRDLDGKQHAERAGMRFYRGKLNKKNVVIVKCGIGKINAALCTQLLIEKFKVNKVIFTGVAGALVPFLNIGDIVVSSHTVQHDFDISVFGRQKGEVPSPVQVSKAEETLLERLRNFYGRKVGRIETSFRLVEADPKLVSLATRAYEIVRKKMKHPPNLVVGTIASGDRFVSTKEEALELQRGFGALCAEMEGAATGYSCLLYEKPFVIIRTISDTADNKAPSDFKSFVKQSARVSHRIVSTMLSLKECSND